jgi:hypothetical protein
LLVFCDIVKSRKNNPPSINGVKSEPGIII